jgi:sigma-B regulation protein RsbU (phosphoserine phosphatase)
MIAPGAEAGPRLRGFRSIALRLVVWVLLTCGAIYVASLLYSQSLAREVILAAAEREAEQAAKAAIGRIDSILQSVQQSTELAGAVIAPMNGAASIEGVLRSLVEGNARIYGSTASFAPYAFDPHAERYAPYYFRGAERIERQDLAAPTYRYWEKDWYTDAMRSGRPSWSQPYFDEGGGGVWMVTYTVPIGLPGAAPRLRGVVTADVALGWLNERMAEIHIGRTGFGVVVSRDGTLLAHPDPSLLATAGTKRTAAQGLEVSSLVRAIAERGSGFEHLDIPRLGGRRARVAYATLEPAGWTVAVIYPEDELLAEADRLVRLQALLVVAGLAALGLVVTGLAAGLTRPLRDLARSAAVMATGDLEGELPPVRSRDEMGALSDAFRHMRDSLRQHIEDLRRTTAAKQKLESELEVARSIQMAMLPAGHAGGEPHSGFTLAARLVPALAVGGDLFDYLQIGGRVAFLVGDVSGKGVPAALFMARAKTLFQVFAAQEPDLGSLLRAANKALCAENEATMFVTLFCAILDTTTGRLFCAAAGHEPPFILPGSGGPLRELAFEGGPPLGLFEDAEFPVHAMALEPGDLLIITTDGVSEAMNPLHELFTAERLPGVITRASAPTPGAACDAILAAVRAFAGGAPQSDDITVMAIQYGPPPGAGPGL